MRSTPMSHRLDVRGYTMLLCAFIWALIGYGVLHSSALHVPGTFHDEIPTWARLVLWFVPAGAAAALSFSRRWDWIALPMLMAGPMLRCVSYLIAWALALIPGGKQGFPDGWYSAAFYLALIGLVGIASASRRQPHLRPVRGESGREGGP